jgi:hypothetical protein
MKQHPPIPRRPLAGALACMLAAAACADQPAGPAVRAEAPVLNAGAQPPLISNAVRYRDAGQKPGVGRSGSASLSVMALLDAAGITHIDVVSGSTTQPGTGAGTLGNVQLKVFVSDSADDALVSNFHKVGSGRWSYEVMGPVRGTALQVQAGVGGIDGARTDMVTVRDTVVLAPDLRVTLYGQDQALAGTPTNLAAWIDERNGDVGARADCVLYVDGVATDRAQGIWVDAWSGVYCIFTHTFAAAGQHGVEIRLENVSPADYDPSDNSGSRTINVVASNSFSYNASAWDSRGSQSYYNRRRWTEASGTTGEDLRDFAVTYADQYANISGWRPVGLSLPASAQLSLSSGGNTYHNATLQGLGAGHAGGQFCSSTTDPAAGATFFLCTTGDAASGYTSFQYQRTSNSIAYHSLNYTAQWDPAGTPQYVYSDYAEYASGTPSPAYGSTFDFVVELADAAGHAYSASPTVTLGLNAWNYSSPLQCNVVDDWYYDFLEYCWSQSDEFTGRSGFAYLYP